MRTTRLTVLIAPVAAAGAVALAAAGWKLAQGAPSATLLGVGVLAIASILAEAFPVPMEALPGGNLSLAATVVAAAAVLYGWPAGTIVAAASPLALGLVRWRGLPRVAYNTGTYAVAGAAAGLAAGPLDPADGVGTTIASVAVASAGFYCVTVVLVSVVLAWSSSEPFVPTLLASIRWTAPPFAMMASVSLMLVVLWRESPLLASALVGPVLATALYQRSTHRLLRAMRLALTDPVTGLGNHRHFHELLERAVDTAAATNGFVSVCLLDLDDFKRINDTYGHPAGDGVLAQVGGCLRGDGEAFRLGGDEFALLLDGFDEQEARAATERVLARLGALECRPGGRLTFSAGLATFPAHAIHRGELFRVADDALYTAKRAGKNQLRIADPTAPPLAAAV